MNFTILTLFPEFIEQGLTTSILGKACEKGLLSFKTVNIRDYSKDKNNRVDDYTYGGGAGMLIQAQPVFDAYNYAIKGLEKKPRTIYVTPQGKPFTQTIANELSAEDDLVFICGHYEGIDERVLDEVVTDRYSIGDYVLTGGELPALVMIDAISRLVPGVLGNDSSSEIESFYGSLLEYPQYTRPEIWRGKRVPEQLLSGDPKIINSWRLEKQTQLTKTVRPDLYDKYELRCKCLDELKKDKKNYIHVYEAIRRGFGEIVCCEPLMVYLPMAGIMYIAEIPSMQRKLCDYTEQEIFDLIPENVDCIIMPEECANRLIEAGLFDHPCPVYNAVYTEKVHKKIKNKDIRQLGLDDIDYINKYYGHHDDDSYNRDRLSRGLVYGIYEGDKLCGFIGNHCEGSIGMLFVEEGYRGKGYAADLENYMINKELERGNIPFGQVITDNIASVKLQEKNGLYIGNKIMTWLHKKA